jgi:small subunit ribosomal protein S21
MPELSLQESDRIEWALKAFKRQMQRSGILGELRRRRHYVKPGDARRRKSKAAQLRQRRAALKTQRYR